MDRPLSPVEFLEERGKFRNTHGVSIMLMMDDAVHLSCPFPGVSYRKGISLEIVNLYDSAEEFMKGLNIRSKIDMNALTPADMLRRYEVGTMKISCAVEKNRRAVALIFHWVDGCLIATNEDTFCSHRVDKDLRLGDDYITYTETYFMYSA